MIKLVIGSSRRDGGEVRIEPDSDHSCGSSGPGLWHRSSTSTVSDTTVVFKNRHHADQDVVADRFAPGGLRSQCVPTRGRTAVLFTTTLLFHLLFSSDRTIFLEPRGRFGAAASQPLSHGAPGCSEQYNHSGPRRRAARVMIAAKSSYSYHRIIPFGSDRASDSAPLCGRFVHTHCVRTRSGMQRSGTRVSSTSSSGYR